VDIPRICSFRATTDWPSVEPVTPGARLPAVSRFPTSLVRWKRCSMSTPLSTHPRWCDVEGSRIALFCWVEQVAEATNPGMSPTRLHQRGQIVGRGLDSLYVCFSDNICSLCHPTCCAYSPTRPTGTDADDTSMGALERPWACNHLPSSQRHLIPGTTPIGWVFLDCRRADRSTIRCQRSDWMVDVLSGQWLSDHGMTGVLSAACSACGDGR
jgi:hypothetical protein